MTISDLTLVDGHPVETSGILVQDAVVPAQSLGHELAWWCGAR